MVAMAAEEPEASVSPPVAMRTNPGDVQLASSPSTPNNPAGSNDASSDLWKSLASSSKDPMAGPTPVPALSSNNVIANASSETKPRPKKDDYGHPTGWGIRTSVGPAIQQSISAGLFNGNVHQDIYFQPGFRFDIEPFYNVANGFGFGLEGAFIYNSVSSLIPSAPGLAEQNPQAGGLVSGGPTLGNGAFYQVPVLLNMRFQIPNSGRLRGYGLGGFGGVWQYTTASLSTTAIQFTQVESGLTTQYSYTPQTVSSHQWNFAFQLGCGFQYNLLPGLDLQTSFKTFITPNPLIFSDGTSQVKASYNYALEIGLDYRF